MKDELSACALERRAGGQVSRRANSRLPLEATRLSSQIWNTKSAIPIERARKGL
jgi:hypothetical protein